MSKADNIEKDQELNEEQNQNQSSEAGKQEVNEEQTASELDTLQKQLEEQKDKFVRLMADFENYKRRTANERIDLMQTAGKDIVVSLLDVLDDCDRAEKQMQTDTDVNHVKEGARLVFNKLRSIMQSKGVKAIESIQSEFDVEHHEAVAEIPAPTPDLSGKVIDEVQKGYMMNDKLIRFAKVVVGK